MKLEELSKCGRPGPTFFQLNYFVINKEPTSQAKLHKCLEEIKDRIRNIDSVNLQIEEIEDQNALHEIEIENNVFKAEEKEIRIRQIRRKITANKQHIQTLNTSIATWTEEIKFLKHLFDQIAEHVELKPWDDYDVQLEYWGETWRRKFVNGFS